MSLISPGSEEDRQIDPKGRKKAENSGNGLAHVTGVKKERVEKSEQRGSGRAVTLAIAVGKSDDCVFMLYPKERSNTF